MYPLSLAFQKPKQKLHLDNDIIFYLRKFFKSSVMQICKLISCGNVIVTLLSRNTLFSWKHRQYDFLFSFNKMVSRASTGFNNLRFNMIQKWTKILFDIFSIIQKLTGDGGNFGYVSPRVTKYCPTRSEQYFCSFLYIHVVCPKFFF